VQDGVGRNSPELKKTGEKTSEMSILSHIKKDGALSNFLRIFMTFYIT
jgi:hypothetical protein